MPRLTIFYLFIVLMLCQFSTASAGSLADDLILKAEPFWVKRDDPEMMKKAVALYEKALSEAPRNPLLLKRLAMAQVETGENFMGGKDRKARLDVYGKGMDYSSTLRYVAPDNPAGDFWYVVNRLCYGKEKGFIKTVAFLPECKRLLEGVIRRDKFHSDGGPQRIWAEIILNTPGMLRGAGSFGNLLDAEKMLLEALEDEPRFLMTRLTLARVYLSMNQKEKARKEIHLLLETRFGPDYEFAPENRLDIKKARALLETLQ